MKSYPLEPCAWTSADADKNALAEPPMKLVIARDQTSAVGKRS